MRSSMLVVSLALFACADSGAARSESGTKMTHEQNVIVVRNQVEVTPTITLGGLLTGGVEAVQDAGYTRIIDIRSSRERGVIEEEQAAMNAGIPYTRMTLPSDPASLKVFRTQFVASLDASGDDKTLVHCVSGNRTGFAWALYLNAKGLPIEDAIKEGQRVGMRGGEAILREVMVSQ